MPEARISHGMLLLLIMNTILPTTILFLPSLVVEEAQQDGWLAAVLVTLVGLFFSTIVFFLARRFPRATIIDYLPRVLGRFPGRLLGLAVIIYLLWLNIFVIREFQEFIVTIFLPGTPIIVFAISVLFLAALAVRAGLEVFARTNEIVSLYVLLSIIFLVLAMLPLLNWNYIRPVFGTPLIRIARGGMPALFLFTEPFIFLFLYPYIKDGEKSLPALLGGVATAGLIFTVIVFFCIGVFNYQQVESLTFPVLTMVRLIDIGGFITRVDPLVMAVWVGGMFIKICVFYFAASLALARFLGRRDYRSLVLPLGVVLALLPGILFSNISQLLNQLKWVGMYIFFPLQTLLPVLLLFGAKIRGIKGG